MAGREIDDDDNTLTRRIWSKLDRRLLLVIRVHVRLLPNLIRTQFVNVFYLSPLLDTNEIFRGALSFEFRFTIFWIIVLIKDSYSLGHLSEFYDLF